MYDVIVIGSGPAGYVAAIRASQLGLKTACVEKSFHNDSPQLGGTCLNIGCIPSKTLLDSSHRYADALHQFSDHGIKVQNPTIDIPKMMDRKNKIVAQLTGGISSLFKANNVTQILGTATIMGANTVEVTYEGKTETLETQNIVIASGSSPIDLSLIHI